MKKVLLFALLKLASFSIPAQWTAVPTPATNSILDIKCIGNNVYACGAGGTFIKSTDNGTFWTLTTMAGTPQLQALYFRNSGYGLIASNDGRWYRSTDNGTSWNSQNVPQSLSFVGIAPDDTNVGFLAGYFGQAGVFYKSIDGGASWVLQTTDVGFAIKAGYVIDKNVVIVVGEKNGKGYIGRSNNGGFSWTVTSPSTSFVFGAVHFINQTEGWISDLQGFIYHTTDGGINWSYLTDCYPVINSASRDIFFKDASNGWIVGDNGKILYSSDGGNTWQLQPSGTSAGLNTITFDAVSNKGFIGGESGLILYTANGGGALPISLSSFNGKAINNNIQLFWQTASEQNNKGFDIERLSGNEWKSIGYVNGKGNSTTPADYSFTDERPLAGDNKYRLKQTDIDGKFSYSKVLSIAAGEPENTFSVSPNPSTGDRITISYAVKQTTDVCIEIISSSGQRIKTVVNKKLNSGSYIENISVKSLPNSAYYIQARFGKDKAVTKKIVR